MQLQYLISVNAIIMNKKASYLAGKDSGKVITEKIAPTTKSRSYRTASFHFLPELKEESPTYKYNQIKPLLNFLGYNQGDSSELLETNASTLSRWKNSEKPVDIGKLRSKVVLDIDEIIAKGVRIFGNEQLFQDWLNTTNYSLGDAKPVDLLKDIYSIELVEDAIDALSWGSYS